MLTDESLQQILERLPTLTVGVLGDLFLDRYLDIDSSLTEPSLETGLDAYQVVRVRPSPGAAGTVINNLAALGVNRIVALSAIGDDGEGYELGQALDDLRVVDTSCVVRLTERAFRTPTYTKPMLGEKGRSPRELNRLDIKNRTPLPRAAEEQLLRGLGKKWPMLDALVVLDQVSEAGCGVITNQVRERLAQLGEADSRRFVLADSRERIGLFRFVSLKPNRQECLAATRVASTTAYTLEQAAAMLARQAHRPVFCTAGENGILLAQPGESPPVYVSAYPVSGPLDAVGAGDSTSAGIACALASGVSLAEAAAFGNLVASITIQQIGTTGTATAQDVAQRWKEVKRGP